MSTRSSRCTVVLTDTAGAGHPPSSWHGRKPLESHLPRSAPMSPPRHPPRRSPPRHRPRRPGSLTRNHPHRSRNPSIRRRRPFVLRPRGRATVVVVVLGVPLLIAYGAARVLPGRAVVRRARPDGRPASRRSRPKPSSTSSSSVTVALFIGANLAAALRRTAPVLRRVAALRHRRRVSLVTGTLFASAATGDWQTLPALAAPAAVRRRRSDSRQGRRLLRLLAAVRAPGVGARCSGWSQSRPCFVALVYARPGGDRLAAPFTPRSGPRCTSRSSPPSSCSSLPGDSASSSTRSSSASRHPATAQSFAGRRLRGRPRPAARARRADGPRRRARRRLPCRAVRRPSADPREPRVVRRRPGGGAPRGDGPRRGLDPGPRPAVRRRPEPAPQRAAVPGAVDRGDEDGPRTRRHRRRAVLADRQRFRRPTIAAAEQAARERPDLGCRRCSRRGCASSSPTRRTTARRSRRSTSCGSTGGDSRRS